jgi:hypothetical protein
MLRSIRLENHAFSSSRHIDFPPFLYASESHGGSCMIKTNQVWRPGWFLHHSSNLHLRRLFRSRKNEILMNAARSVFACKEKEKRTFFCFLWSRRIRRRGETQIKRLSSARSGHTTLKQEVSEITLIITVFFFFFFLFLWVCLTSSKRAHKRKKEETIMT